MSSGVHCMLKISCLNLISGVPSPQQIYSYSGIEKWYVSNALNLDVSISLRDSAAKLLIPLTKRLQRLTSRVNYYHYARIYWNIVNSNYTIMKAQLTKQLVRPCTSTPRSRSASSDQHCCRQASCKQGRVVGLVVSVFLLVNGTQQHLITTKW